MPTKGAERELAESDLSTLWSRALDDIRRRILSEPFETWFRRTALVSIGEGEAMVAVPNSFIRDWVTRFYSEPAARALSSMLGREVALRFVSDPEAFAVAARPAPAPPPDLRVDRPPPKSAGRFEDTPLNAAYSFESFIVGPCNRFAHAAALGVAEKPGRAYNPLFLHGSVGLGKTHVLQAICHQILSRNPSSRVKYLSCETFINHFISSIENGDTGKFRSRYRDVDILVLDDVHLLANKERTQEEFFHTFNTLYAGQRQIVLSSDSPPGEIRQLQERLVSRFNGGLVAAMEAPCFETRVAILLRKARERHRELPSDVAKFVAERVTRNIRDLEGAVTRLLGYCALVHATPTPELAREALRDLIAASAESPPVQAVLEVVASRYGLRVADLQSKRRSRSVVLPRQIAMHLARLLTPLSLQEIGSSFGGRDHTTVLYGLERVERHAKDEPAFRGTLDSLKREIQQRAGLQSSSRPRPC